MECMRKIFFSFTFLLWGFLGAEIHSVVVKWSSGHCTERCALTIQERLSRQREIQEIEINPSLGELTLKWAEKRKFSYFPIKRAFQAAGVGVNAIYVEVSGDLQERKDQVYLISKGDKTRFLLMAPVRYQSRRYSGVIDPRVHAIDPSFKAKLMELGKKNVTFSGLLYRPALGGDPILIVEKFRLSPES